MGAAAAAADGVFTENDGRSAPETRRLVMTPVTGRAVPDSVRIAYATAPPCEYR